MVRMMRWVAGSAVALGLLASAAPAQAQITATVVMKSGERHQGQNPWTRVDKGEFSLRKSLHDELRVNASEVLYVDFGGTPDPKVDLSGSQQAVVLRNGTVVKGQLIEMAYATPNDHSSEYLVIIRDEQGREQRYPAAQVARVYFADPDAASGGMTSSQAGDGKGLVVSAKQRWTPTGITVRRGEAITFNTTGEIQLSSDAADIAQSAGAKSQRYASGAPLPREFAGALIAKIGTNGKPFAIGNQTRVMMPTNGPLFLGINDDFLEDNEGEFRVEIERANSRIRR